MWRSTNLGRDGAFSDLRERFRESTWMSVAVSLMEVPGLLCLRRCLRDHAGERNVATHITTRQDCCQRDHEGGVFETNSFLGMLFRRLTARVELNTWWGQQYRQSIRPSRQMLIVDSIKKTSELWTWPVRKNETQPQPCMVSRLHMELGHSDPRGTIDYLRRKYAHRLIIATA